MRKLFICNDLRIYKFPHLFLVNCCKSSNFALEIVRRGFECLTLLYIKYYENKHEGMSIYYFIGMWFFTY